MELYLAEFKTTLLNKYMCTYYDSIFYCLIIHLRENHTLLLQKIFIKC